MTAERVPPVVADPAQRRKLTTELEALRAQAVMPERVAMLSDWIAQLRPDPNTEA